MFGLGFTEILIILTVALLVFGPKQLPEIARTLGRTMGELRRALDEVRYEISQGEMEVKKEAVLEKEEKPSLTEQTPQETPEQSGTSTDTPDDSQPQ